MAYPTRAARCRRTDAAAILTRAARAGIGVLDTAANYGEAEEGAGGAGTSAFRIVTKTIGLKNGLEAVIARARQSAATLDADTLLVHAAVGLRVRMAKRLWDALQRAERRRRVPQDRHLGLCRGRSGRAGGTLPARRDAIPFSLLDQRLLADGSLARLEELGVEIHARSLFLQGLLFLPRTAAGKIASTPRRIWRRAAELRPRAPRRWPPRWALCCRGRKSPSDWSASPVRRNWRKSWRPRKQPLPESGLGRLRARRTKPIAYAVALVRAPTTRRTSASRHGREHRQGEDMRAARLRHRARPGL